MTREPRLAPRLRQGPAESHRLAALLEQVGAMHAQLCPRQVLGVRMGLYGGELLDLDVPPNADKRLLTFVETDGCFADGVSVATGCWLGHRTLRVLDFGKSAAVFVDTHTQRAVRVWPHPAAREHAERHFSYAASRWHAYLEGYAVLPDAELLKWTPVVLATPLEDIVGEPGVRVGCARCGEEVINRREIRSGSQVLCAACAGGAYYVRPISRVRQ
jgi:formylmethanofuran dehydrogenase subunit E